MKAFVVLSFVLGFGITACGGAEPPPQTPATPPGAQLQGAGQGPASAEVDRGSPECKFVVATGRCFVVESAACAAAGCEPSACVFAETFPAQVSCKK